MKCLSIPFVAIAALTTCPITAMAASAPVQTAELIADKTIQTQDRDGDALISLKESAGAALTLFGAMDADGSGSISQPEMLQAAMNDASALRVSTTADQTTAMVASRFAAMDIDGDGAISLPEMMAVNQTIFDMADTNADGYVSASELSSLALDRARTADSR
ncbi:EF-hand domain-containing protein [Asticcacaulis sp.]|uniref:EF-hand domain-containing protein n=1 Tax=Asticcacaulis sp. TaxID=1872648 RepID=UPI003F7B3CCC